MATLNEHISFLAAILSDISNDGDTNFIHVLSVKERQQQILKNDRKNTLKQTKCQTKKNHVYKQTLESCD